jgi:hypothetical protein
MWRYLFIVMVVAIMLFGGQSVAFARGVDLSCDGPFSGILNKCAVQEELDGWKFKAEVDAPNLVLLPWDLSLGLGVRKDVYQNNVDENWIDFEDGWTGYFKITWKGTLLNLSNKE